MGIIKKIFGLETRASLDGGTITPETDAALLRALVGTGEITSETALEIPAFSAAVDFISSTVAMLPVKLYREIPEQHKTEEITDDRRLFLLNDEANPIMSALDAKRAQVRDMLINGAGYLYIDHGEALHYVKYGDVSVQSNSEPIFRDFDILVGAKRYLPFDFVILTRSSDDGVTGRGAVQEHKTLLSAMYNALKYENVISRTGGNKKGFLQADHKLSQEAFDKMKMAWEELYANNGNNMMLLNDGVKYVPSASTSVEMQLNENKRTNSEQIAAIFGLSPEVISGTADTAQYMSAVRTAVLPVVEAYQAALNKSLLTETEKGRYYFTLDTTELLKGDTLSRYQAYAIGLQNNFLQIDEVRYLEDREPIGFNYVKLGLQDVLLDPKTNTVYTPNMNVIAKLGENSLTQEELRSIMEYRKKTNWVKGDKGRFAGSVPEGGSGGNSGLTNNYKGDIMNIENLPVEIPKEKFTEYALDPIRQPDKARAFKEALGYTKVNYCALIDNIRRNLDKSSLQYKRTNEYGDIYEYVMKLTGANGKQANVCTGWINDIGKNELRLTSAYVTDRKVTKDGYS